jgi:hypothetical protein
MYKAQDTASSETRPEEVLETFYGLPANVEYCKTCVISNQRPSSVIEQKHTRNTKKKVIIFKDGICDACRTRDWKDKVNWDDREKELIELCNQHRSHNGAYDCLVPGSGGKDSFYQIRYESAYRYLGSSYLHRLGVEEFSKVDTCRL